MRLLKGTRPGCRVRALCDAPAALAGAFGRAEKAMKALHVRKLYLWPRFQAQVRADLEGRPPELVEVSQRLSAPMALAYEALAELLDACVRELCRTSRLDGSELSLERGLLRSFDEAVRRQLDPVWHTVPPKTRALVADLRTLRMLATHLLRFDPVTFLSYLESLRATEGANSIWLFQPGEGRTVRPTKD